MKMFMKGNLFWIGIRGVFYEGVKFELKVKLGVNR